MPAGCAATLDPCRSGATSLPEALRSTGGFDSEQLLAYELGWRGQPRDDLSLTASTFFNEYDDLRSAEPGPPNYQPFERWRLLGGYTYLHKDLGCTGTARSCRAQKARQGGAGLSKAGH